MQIDRLATGNLMLFLYIKVEKKTEIEWLKSEENVKNVQIWCLPVDVECVRWKSWSIHTVCQLIQLRLIKLQLTISCVVPHDYQRLPFDLTVSLAIY